MSEDAPLIFRKLTKKALNMVTQDNNLIDENTISYKDEDETEAEVDKDLSAKSAEEVLDEDLLNFLVVREEVPIAGRQVPMNLFYVFKTYRACYDMIVKGDKYAHEVILSLKQQKLRFDFDLSWEDAQAVLGLNQFAIGSTVVAKSEPLSTHLGSMATNTPASAHEFAVNALKLLIQIVQKVVAEKTGIVPYVIVCRSIDEKAEKPKLSYHLIVGAYTDNNHAAQVIANEIYELYRAANSYAYDTCLDLGVYKAIQNFRLCGCCKIGTTRRKVIVGDPIFKTGTTFAPDVDYRNWLLTLITYIDDSIDVHMTINERASTRTKPFNITNNEMEDISSLPDGFNQIMSSFTAGLQLSAVEGNLVFYKRNSPSMCRICDRRHDNENSMYVIVTDKFYVVKCRRADIGSKSRQIVIPIVKVVDKTKPDTTTVTTKKGTTSHIKLQARKDTAAIPVEDIKKLKSR